MNVFFRDAATRRIRSRRKFCGALFGVAAIFASSAAFPHAAEDRIRPFHGGLAQSAGEYHLELVMRDGQGALYLYDRQNTPLPNDEFTGSALVRLSEGTLELTWRAEGRERLVLNGEFKVEDVRQVIATITPPLGQPFSVGFAIPAVPIDSSALP